MADSKEALLDGAEPFGPLITRAELSSRAALSLGPAAGDGPALEIQLGGAPSLPDGVAWPMREGLPHGEAFQAWMRDAARTRQWTTATPLHFMASFNLGEARAAFTAAAGAPAWPLPDTGRLWFFWEPIAGALGQAQRTARVLWGEAGGPSPTQPPEAWPADSYTPQVLAERRSALRPSWGLPYDIALGFYGDGSEGALDDERQDLLAEFEDWASARPAGGLLEFDESGLRILGHASALQRDPVVEAASLAAGLLDPPARWDFLPESEIPFDEWLLLLQLPLPWA